MRWTTAIAVVVGLHAGLGFARADPGPFDMLNEPTPQHKTVQQPVSTPATGVGDVRKVQPPVLEGAPETMPVGALVPPRPILPMEVLRLGGELDSRSWNINFTRGEADSPATLTIGYKSALVVAPESSRLRVFINDHPVLESPISAPESMRKLSVRLPVGLLHSGPNLIRIEASQRHRTDCSIGSTYELWTDIYGSDSAIHFDSPNVAILKRIQDLNAAGVDQRGVARLRIISPALGQKVLTGAVLRLAQSAAVLIGEPNQTVLVEERSNSPGGVGVLTAVIGTSADLQTLLPALPIDAATRPIVAFIDDPILGLSTLVVSGPTTLAVSQAVASIASLASDPLAERRTSIATSQWFAPDAPMAWGSNRYKLSELGVRTQEFTGRRFDTEFMIGLPADFYAASYGHATLLLDAAYSGEVLPGSHLDVFVNNHITATTPITTLGGAIVRHLPIRLLITHFKPGPNLIRFEADLNSAADELCRTPGEVNLPSRFVLFDTSEFLIPDYARIARLPDLAALAGTGFPYSRAAAPVALVVDNSDADAVSAAATLLARIALAAGRIVPFELVPAAAAGDRNAIFVTTAVKAPGEALAQLGIDQATLSAWKAPEVAEIGAKRLAGGTLNQSTAQASALRTSDKLDTQATFDRWRNALSDGGGWRGNVSFLQDWLQRTFQFTAGSLRFLPSADVTFDAPAGSMVLLAQGESPGGEGAWLLLTAPTSELLRLARRRAHRTGAVVPARGARGLL